MELTIFLQRELVTPHDLELRAFIESLARRNVAFLDGIVHHRTEDGHLKTDGGVTDKRNCFFFGRFDFNLPQNPDAPSLQNLGAAFGFVIRKDLRHLVADFPNAITPVAPRSVLSPPCRIAAPKLIANKMNLG